MVAIPQAESSFALEKGAAHLDQLDPMAFDFSSSGDSLASKDRPHLPLTGAGPARCVDASLWMYHDSPGVPASKINLGISFYGTVSAPCTGLIFPGAGTDTTHFPLARSFYFDILPAFRSFRRIWDDKDDYPTSQTAARC